jgi:hypothetical protein
VRRADNLTTFMDVCLLWVLFVVRLVFNDTVLGIVDVLNDGFSPRCVSFQ